MMTGHNSGPTGLLAIPSGVPVFPGTVNPQGEVLRIGECIANGFDPSVTGLDRPVGSIVTSRNGGAAWQKSGSASTAWVAVGAAAPESITNAMLADAPAHTMKGNATGAAATPADLTRDQISILLDAFLRSQVSVSRQGFIAETYPRIQSITATAPAAASSGVASYAAVSLLAGDPITEVAFTVSSVGVGISMYRLGLYDAAGNLLAVTANQLTAWQTIGFYTAALAYNVLASGLYYVGLLQVGTTLAGMLRGSSSTAALYALWGGVGGGQRVISGQAGLTDLPSVADFVTGPGSGLALPFWAGLSS